MKNLIRIISILVSVFFLSYFSSVLFVLLYAKLYPSKMGGSWIPGEAAYFIVSIVPIFLFFTSLLFTIYGKKEKYWAIGIIPALVIVRIYYTGFIELIGIYIPIALLLLGWLIGFGVSKLLAKKSLKA